MGRRSRHSSAGTKRKLKRIIIDGPDAVTKHKPLNLTPSLAELMADKPSRALVLYGDGLARGVGSHSPTDGLHSLASLSSCGFLSLPDAPPSESEDERIVREFALLLDAPPHLIYTGKDSATQTLGDRFMGMKAAVVTSDSGLGSFCGKLGLSVLRLDQFVPKDFDLSESSVGVVIRELVKLLGFEDGRVLETSLYDLVFVHIRAVETGRGIPADVGYVNDLVGGIMQVAPPGSEIGSRLHLSVLMSYGHVKENDHNDFSIQISSDEIDPVFHALVPRQSYTMRGENLRENVRHFCPMLIAQWQYAVTRMDMAKAFSFGDFKLRGGNLVIPADRFIHEVAFKLWKAPKYGA